jgi:outer membrane protein
MRIRAGTLAVAALLVTVSAAAQEAVPPELSLQQALDIARRNNPTYLQAANDKDVADWDVKQAWGQLLPSASASSGVSWQGPGEQQLVGGLTLGDLGFGGQPSYYFSSYRIGLSYSLNWSTILGPSQAKAQRNATTARIRQSEATLVTQVTQGYLDVLRQQEGVRLAQQQVENAQYNLRLAQGRLEVGAATPIDVGQAQVQVGRAQVGVLQAQNALATARMRLLQRMGVSVDQDVSLTTTFDLSEPTWSLQGLYDGALRNNPGLLAARSSKHAADIGVSSARSAYYPSLSLSTGWSGFTREASSTGLQIAQAQAQVAGAVSQCNYTNQIYSRLADPLPPLDCTQYRFTDAQRQAIINANDQFPFSFEKSPPSVSLSLSVPLFQGLSRQRNVEAARAQREDLAQQLRDQELSLRADLSIDLATVKTAYESARLEEQNRDLADQQLRLARERYQLGAITFVELVNAQTVLAQADRDRTAAIFAYHDAVSALEALVGTSLRN